MGKRIFINLDLCCGCESCAAACSYYHHDQSLLAHGEVKESQASLPFHCQHCEQPTCETACPTQAIKRDDDGVVKRSQFLCIGCNSCIEACAFGVIRPDLKKHIPAKCNLCIERIGEGKIPKCVSACTSGALYIAELSEDVRDKDKVQITSRMRSNRLFTRR